MRDAPEHAREPSNDTLAQLAVLLRSTGGIRILLRLVDKVQHHHPFARLFVGTFELPVFVGHFGKFMVWEPHEIVSVYVGDVWVFRGSLSKVHFIFIYRTKEDVRCVNVNVNGSVYPEQRPRQQGCMLIRGISSCSNCCVFARWVNGVERLRGTPGVGEIPFLN